MLSNARGRCSSAICCTPRLDIEFLLLVKFGRRLPVELVCLWLLALLESVRVFLPKGVIFGLPLLVFGVWLSKRVSL